MHWRAAGKPPLYVNVVEQEADAIRASERSEVMLVEQVIEPAAPRQERLVHAGHEPQQPAQQRRALRSFGRNQDAARDRVGLVELAQKAFDFCRILSAIVVAQHILTEMRIAAEHL